MHPDRPGNSLIIGNNEKGALEVYGLDGELRIERITTGTTFWGNVDVRQGVIIGVPRDLDLMVATYNGGLRFYVVDPATRRDAEPTATDGNGHASPPKGGEGLCLYAQPQTGVTHDVRGDQRRARSGSTSSTTQDNDGLLADLSSSAQFALGQRGRGLCRRRRRPTRCTTSEGRSGYWGSPPETEDDPTTGTLVDPGWPPNGNLVPGRGRG